MTKITSETRFRKFNFTLYERLDTIQKHIDKIFNTKSCPFQILQFQFETNQNSTESGRYHAQGFAKLRKGQQLRIGHYNSKTRKGSGLKLIFEANIHFEFANGTDIECLAYTEKDFNRCKNPKHQPCKCDFYDLSKICRKCNSTCKRSYARINKDSKIARPFRWDFDESKYEKEEKDPYDEATKEVLKGRNVDEVIAEYATKCKNWGKTTQGLRDIAKALKKQMKNPLQEIDRYWEPCIIFI
jgi:hypothetical protein